MFKNQLQELAQRSCFNLPSYSCVREGPDHAPRFKATVTFNGESFESPGFCHTLRQAEHAAAEVALNTLSQRGSSQSLAAQILDETGVCKSLLQETAQRAGINLPLYSVERSGPGHMPVFVSTVQVAGMRFVGESAKTKKQAEKNAATAAWSSLKQLVMQANCPSGSSADSHANEERLQMAIGRILMNAAQGSSTVRVNQGPSPVQVHQGPSPVPVHQGPSPVPTPRVRIKPLEEQPGQERLNSPSLSQTSINTNSVITTDQEPEVGSKNANADSKVVTTANRLTAFESGNIEQQRAAPNRTVKIDHEIYPQVAYFPINQPHSEAPNWAQSGTSTYIIAHGGDVGPSERFIPLVQPGYTVIWTGDNQQYGSTGPVFKPVASLAPRVHVRQAIPVCSAPPPLPEAKNQTIDTTAAAALQVLNDLKL